jgi:transcriptional regulator with XRE-family HTH domain
MDHPGIAIARLRKRKKLSQEELAIVADVSQATVSRLEKQEQAASLQTLAKIARALGVGLSELTPTDALSPPDPHEDTYYAFCENPFCSLNRLHTSDGAPVVTWGSWQSNRTSSWAELNFCRSCGSDLVKECPSCSKRLDESGTRYCTRCGTQITKRPTEDEWKKIRVLLKLEEDDIPF